MTRLARIPQWLCQTALGLGLGLGLGVASAQPLAAPAPTGSAAARALAGTPSWSELSSEQRRALAPLAGTWAQISEAQRRKWIALAANFARMPATEQSRLHGRMNEWVALSPQQRAQARLNFGETQQLSADEKRAKWEAYQALTPEERRKLAASGASRTPTTAAAVKPVPPRKLATMPKSSPEDSKPPRIVAVPPGEAVEPAN